MTRWKTVIHVHTNYSYDSNRAPAALLETARAQGVDCIAVTDHDEIDGALEARDLSTDVQIVVGEEVSSAEGHIIGLFLTRRIPPGLSAEETIAEIRAQGGVVLAPHPSATLCDDSLGATTLARIAPQLDGVEICNAQNVLIWEDWWAARFARQRGLPAYVGADGHIDGYLDGCYQWLAPFHDPASFLASLRTAELRPGRFGFGYFAAMGGRHVWDKVVRRPWRDFGRNTPGWGRAPRPTETELGT